MHMAHIVYESQDDVEGQKPEGHRCAALCSIKFGVIRIDQFVVRLNQSERFRLRVRHSTEVEGFWVVVGRQTAAMRWSRA